MANLDRIRGMFMGAFLGDALGAPHEFRCNSKTRYTGKLQYRAFMITRWQGRKELEIGQITDDSEMIVTLLRTMIDDGDYIQENVIKSYIEWANSGVWMMGKNTRALFKGIKTIKGYKSRIAKTLELLESKRSQSNGSMMRCCPLVLLDNYDYIKLDSDITNPTTISYQCNQIYIYCLRQALLGKSSTKIYKKAKSTSKSMSIEIQDVFRQIERNIERDIAVNKGWCCHALWCAMYVLKNHTSYNAAMKWVINHPGSDTDTNACIAGSLMGALVGLKMMKSNSITNQNISIVLNCDTENGPTPRQTKYTVKDFYKLTKDARKLFVNSI